jgi:glutamine cyclotransferase
MSGGWTTTLSLPSAAAVYVTFWYNLTQSPHYESDESSEVVVSIDGALKGAAGNSYVARIVGDGDGGPSLTTGWVLKTVDLGVLSAGLHELSVGAYNSKKDLSDESTTAVFDQVTVVATEGEEYFYVDDPFRGSNRPSYASGTDLGDGRVRVHLGGNNNNLVDAMSGGWRRSFTLPKAIRVTATVRYSLTQSPDYESDEVSQVLLSVDGILRGVTAGGYLAQVVGNGDGGPDVTTGVVTTQVDLGVLAAGPHVLIVGGYNNKKNAINEFTDVIIEDVAITRAYEVTAQFPHDAGAYTQGLVWADGVLFESTGLYGQSSVRRVDLQTGGVLMSKPLPANRFGEGLAFLNGTLYQLTWKEGVAYTYDAATLALRDSVHYPGQGWGLTTDGTSLIMSDGSDVLRFIAPTTFQLQRVVYVRFNGAPLARLNELEYVNGEVLANVYQTDWIVRIDPATGVVRERIDFADLYRNRPSSIDYVMNGIALAPDGQQLLVTGKFWPVLFQVRLNAPVQP